MNKTPVLALVMGIGCATARPTPPTPPTSAPPVARAPLTPEVVARVFAANQGALDACHAAGQRSSATVGGFVTIRLTLGDDGRVAAAEAVGGDYPIPAVAACVAASARSFVFPPPTADARSIVHTVNFARAAAAPTGPVDLLAQLELRRSQFAAGMSPVMPVARGTLATSDTQNYAVPLRAGRCYKIVGVGGEGTIDLDLKLYDARGEQVDADIATDNYPVIGLTRALCPTADATFRLEVVMYSGAGEYAVQVFGSDSPSAAPAPGPRRRGAPPRRAP